MASPRSLATSFPRVILTLALLALWLTPAAAKKKEKIFPAEILHAKFVYVTVYPGVSSPTPEDIIARDNVDAAFRKWGRYTAVSSANQADLVIAVRVGGQKPNVRVGTSPIGTGGEFGPQDDMLAVFGGHTDFGGGGVGISGSDPVDAPPLWRSLSAGCLDPPAMACVAQFRKAVEDAETNQGTKKP